MGKRQSADGQKKVCSINCVSAALWCIKPILTEQVASSASTTKRNLHHVCQSPFEPLGVWWALVLIYLEIYKKLKLIYNIFEVTKRQAKLNQDLAFFKNMCSYFTIDQVWFCSSLVLGLERRLALTHGAEKVLSAETKVTYTFTETQCVGLLTQLMLKQSQAVLRLVWVWWGSLTVNCLYSI